MTNRQKDIRMTRTRKIIIAAAGLAVAGLVVPSAASAANGGSWLLGRSNSESATTKVTNSAATPALSLVVPSGIAPLAVNSTKTVTNLSADRLDGLSSGSFLRSTGKAADANLLDGNDSTKFAMRSAKTGTIAHNGYWDGMGAKCPTGTVFVSGGGYMPEFADYIYYSGPDFTETGALIPNSWIVMGDYGVGVSNVTCHSPSGASIPGVATSIDDTMGFDDMGLMAATTEKGDSVSDLAAAKIAKVKEMRK
jgi:hypothetical protein